MLFFFSQRQNTLRRGATKNGHRAHCVRYFSQPKRVLINEFAYMINVARLEKRDELKKKSYCRKPDHQECVYASQRRRRRGDLVWSSWTVESRRWNWTDGIQRGFFAADGVTWGGVGEFSYETPRAQWVMVGQMVNTQRARGTRNVRATGWEFIMAEIYGGPYRRSCWWKKAWMGDSS